MSLLPVNEIFETLQGEGRHAGTPSVFIRLQGCPVGCPWCDTRFTWEVDRAKVIGTNRMLAKDHSGEDSFADLEAERLSHLISRFHARHTVITGGEPAQYDLTELTAQLLAQGRTVQIETSGTFPVLCDPNTWITVSPKLEMPGGLAVRDDVLAQASEIKMPVGKMSDILAMTRLLDRGVVGAMTPIYLQPLSLSPKATELCVKNAIANNWKVSLQIHALAGWR